MLGISWLGMSQAPLLQQSKSQQALGDVLDHEEVAAGDAGDASAANVEQQLHGAPLRLVSPPPVSLDLRQRRPRPALLNSVVIVQTIRWLGLPW